MFVRSLDVNDFLIAKNKAMADGSIDRLTVKIQKFGTAQTIAIIVLKIEKFDVTLY